MKYRSLPPSAQVAYADLLEALYSSSIPDRGISYFTRQKKDRKYWYMQYMIGSNKRSRYLGPDTADIRQLVDRCRRRQAHDKQHRPDRERHVAIGIAAGLHTMTPAEARIYEVLTQVGLFEAGAVIVGTHAFLHIGNMLCVRWERGIARTLDIDVARAQSISIASMPVEEPIEEILQRADKGVLAVPALDSRQPSTSFTLRNQNLTVSLLTPLHSRPVSKPVMLDGVNVAAMPVRFLDYLIEASMPAAVPHGGGLLINIPDPARFALHKLVVSQRRPRPMAAKSRKDVAHAAAVLDALKDLRPGDIQAAGEAAARMGEKFTTQLITAAGLLDDDMASRIRDAVLSVAKPTNTGAP